MLRRNQNGQSLVEFALALPIFILIVMGVFDLGRAVWQGNTLAESARQAVRYAVTSPTDCAGIKNAAISSAAGVTLTTSSVSISEPSGTLIGDPVQVTVTATFTPVTPLIGTVIASQSLSMTRASTMIIENELSGSACVN